MKEHATAERTIDLGGLPGIVVRPRGANAVLVLAHGAGAGMRHPFMHELAHALAARGIATVRWEFPYMAAGRKRVDAPAIAEAAVRTAVEEARRAVPRLPLFAGGKSFGGRMTSSAHANASAAAAGASDATAVAPLPVRGIVFYGFPLHPPEKPGPRMEADRLRRAAGVERADHLAHARGPLLFLQGTRDELAPLPRLRPVIKKLGARAQLVVIDGADHGFTRKGCIAELADATRVWIDSIVRV